MLGVIYEVVLKQVTSEDAGVKSSVWLVAQASRLCRRRLKPAATEHTYLIAFLSYAPFLFYLANKGWCVELALLLLILVPKLPLGNLI